jgi:hypothetical protein
VRALPNLLFRSPGNAFVAMASFGMTLGRNTSLRSLFFEIVDIDRISIINTINHPVVAATIRTKMDVGMAQRFSDS